MYRKLLFDRDGPQAGAASAPLSRRSLLAGSAAAAAAALSPAAFGQAGKTEFRRISPQFIAALAAPDATAGGNAETWGLWPLDPGPRGVRLSHYRQLEATGTAPAGWAFDPTDWWLEEHGLIMEAPDFPLPAGEYFVTGDRSASAVLTVEPKDANGDQRWSLDSRATLHDVTHLACRSARYTPDAGACTPAQARQERFPVRPGAEMPAVDGCAKQDYAVLIVIGLPA